MLGKCRALVVLGGTGAVLGWYTRVALEERKRDAPVHLDFREDGVRVSCGATMWC